MTHPKASDEQILNYDLGIEDVIEKFIPREGYPSALHVPIWDLLDRGGKRFRPILSYLCCKMVGGNTKQINQLAAAVELLHNMTLVHDDIEDNSDRRRGKPCIHLIYGIPSAINTADMMAVKVFDMILTHKINPKSKIILLQKLTQRINQMLQGQAIEIENRDTALYDEGLVLEILKGKTSALIMLSSEIGIIIGKGSDVQLKLVERYAGYIGLAFQIIDDVLNLIATKKYGKEIGGDLREGKRTMIVSHFMKHSSDYDKLEFLKYFGKKNSSYKEIKKMLSLLKKYDSIKYCQKQADYYLNCGLYYLSFLPDNDARNSLSKLSAFLTKRNW
jgi:geranylgeranyl diphosphate synthase type I